MTRSYDAFCAACGICPVQFTMHIIMDWMTDYCRQGFTARSLSSRLSGLRRYARRLRMPFPALDSYEWADINDLRTALLKIDPTDPKQATVVGLYWIMRVAALIGITTVMDLYTCAPWALQLHTRALVAHCCCLRGVEHRSGLRVGDIQVVTPKFLSLRIADRYSEKKLKLRPGRLCVIPVVKAPWSAGEAMLAYIARLRSSAPPSAILFPIIDQTSGRLLESQTASDARFIKEFKCRVEAAGMKPKDAKNVSNHSFRAGGATDWSTGGMDENFVQAQGGWTSRCFRIYIRPATHHFFRTAARLVAASVNILATFTLPAPSSFAQAT